MGVLGGAGSEPDLIAEFTEILTEVLGASAVGPDSGFFEELGADSLSMAKFCARVRKRADLPKVSMKDVYRWPNVRALAAGLASAAPVAAPAAPVAVLGAQAPATSAGQVIEEYRALLAAVLEVPDVAPEAHVFDELGADSLTMAKFCARVRKRPDLPAVSMKDIYRYPNLAALAGALVVVAPDIADPSGTESEPVVVAIPPDEPAWAVPPRPVGRLKLFACGFAQLLMLLVLPLFISMAMIVGYGWLAPATGPVEAYLRAVVFSAAAVVVFFAMPVIAKWVLIGRWKPTEFRVWTWKYFRFWVVKSLIQRNPLLSLMIGSPLYVLYLRALGARIGRGTTLFLSHVPVCPDLLTIGADTVIRRDTVINLYHAESGMIRTGRVTLGARVVVSAKTVIDIDTRMGDDSQLGHASALHPGQSIPAGQRWYGSPAQPGDTDFSGVETAPTSTLRRTLFGIAQLANTILFALPLALATLAGIYLSAQWLVGTDFGYASMTHFTFYRRAMIAAAALLGGVVLLWLPIVGLLARALRLLVKPGKVYRLHGIRHSAMRTITRLTNSKLYGVLAADSSLVVHYLRVLGYRLKPVLQTGTNFGTVGHDSPFGVSVGTGTVVADGLTLINVDYSASSFRMSPITIGRNNFLGNSIAYPSAGRTGDDCLLATMVMVPIDGPVREGVGLLGSPAFEIPRTVARDHGLAVRDPELVRRGVRRKNLHNGVTIALHLLARWVLVLAMFIAAEAAGELFYTQVDYWSFPLIDAVYALAIFLFSILVERTVTRLAVLRPEGVSIYDKDFWRHERYWKMTARSYLGFLTGTPLKPFFWRILGVKMGRRVFDDGVGIPEKSFVTVGDYATLNVFSHVQCHSQEDGAFKSERTSIGAGVTLGIAAFIHYGVHVGDGAELGAASFLMKGEQVPPGEYWAGNPAHPGERVQVVPETEIATQTHSLEQVDLDLEPADLDLEPADLDLEPADLAVAGVPSRRPVGALAAYAVVLGAGGLGLSVEPEWNLAWRGLGVGSMLIAARLFAAGRLARRAKPAALEVEATLAHQAVLEPVTTHTVQAFTPAEAELASDTYPTPARAWENAPAQEIHVFVPTPTSPATPVADSAAEARPAVTTGAGSDSWARLAAEFARLDALAATLQGGQPQPAPGHGDGTTRVHLLPRQSGDRGESSR